jgi:hypothetical protein
MIKLKDILNEAPLGTYTAIGGFDKGASYKDPRDRAALNHPVTIQKVKDMLKNTSVDFDFYFVNKPGLRKFSEKGKVPYDFIVKPIRWSELLFCPCPPVLPLRTASFLLAIPGN